LRSLRDAIDDRMSPFVKSGRAVFGVVLRGYIGRLLTTGEAAPDPATVEYVDKIANRITDLRRGLDYLGTRPDVDATRIGFFGPSSGAQIGLILAAVEGRYRGVIMLGAGLPSHLLRYAAEANPVNFTPHIRAPKLIVQGRYDEDTPLKTSMEPMYKLMPRPKQFFLYDGGHVASPEVQMTATAGWLDATLGPVRR
jgi:pimeloyl-ACP methyl ester carboxylesterase